MKRSNEIVEKLIERVLHASVLNYVKYCWKSVRWRLEVMNDIDKGGCDAVPRAKAYLEQIQQRMGIEELEIKCINTFSLGFLQKEEEK